MLFLMPPPDLQSSNSSMSSQGQQDDSTPLGHGQVDNMSDSERETSTLQKQNLQTRQDSSSSGLAVPAPLLLRDQHISASRPYLSESRAGTYCGTVAQESTKSPAHDPPLKTPERFWFRCSGAFFALFTAGWADGLTGTILPHIKADFNISYILSALLFVTSTLGFALGVIMIDQVMCLLGSFQLSCIKSPISPKSRDGRETRKRTQVHSPAFVEEERMGDKHNSSTRARFRILVIASVLHASFFVFMGTATGLSNVLIAYFLGSLGKGLLNKMPMSQRAPNVHWVNYTHVIATIGAFAAPLVCQTLLARDIPWTHFYLGSLVLSAINTTLLTLSFRPTRNDSIEERTSNSNGIHLEEQSRSNSMSTDVTEKESPTFDRSGMAMSEKTLDANTTSFSPPLTAQRGRSYLRLALKLRYVWAFSFFMLIYGGCETSTQGYMATYLLVVRNGNPNTVGYVTSGFWGGMAITRFITGIVSPSLSFTRRKHAIHIILVSALSMHLCIWFINSIFADAFSTGFVGLLYGPVYPSVLALAVDLLPKEAHMVAMAIIAGFSNLGSSIFPFIVGALSNLHGPKVLVYTTVSQTVALIILWTFFPSRSPFRHY